MKKASRSTSRVAALSAEERRRRERKRFFSAAFKKLADDYFSVDENARDLDADSLLGMQDWGVLTPSFSIFVLDDHHAKVQVSFALDKKYANDPEIKTQPANIYTVYSMTSADGRLTTSPILRE